MSRTNFDADVIVVGGGPVGLFLAAELARDGVDVIVFEQQERRHTHSRSIGIHPPALEALDRVGATDRLIAEGVAVRRGWARTGNQNLGSISFETLDTKFPFVLTLPQHRTERILEARLCELGPGALKSGWAVESVIQEDGLVRLTGALAEASSGARGGFARFEATARYVVGCDGRESLVRQSAGIAFETFAYQDSYVMGDFADRTDLGSEAAIYLTPGGVVESFPLPGGLRRWVVKTSERVHEPSPESVARAIRDRLDLSVEPESCTMVSAFGCERALASSFIAGRVVLAGDSAHLVPPIGGQGMNLGWLDAAALVPKLREALLHDGPSRSLQEYGIARRGLARVAMRRAEVNLRLGRATRWNGVRNALVRGLLSAPFSRLTAGMFTMRGLG